MASTIYLLAYPSPYGFDALLIFSYSSFTSNNFFVSSYITSSFVPTNFKVPAAIHSGLSVVSLNTSTGFRSEGASS